MPGLGGWWCWNNGAALDVDQIVERNCGGFHVKQPKQGRQKAGESVGCGWLAGWTVGCNQSIKWLKNVVGLIVGVWCKIECERVREREFDVTVEGAINRRRQQTGR